MGLMNRRDAYGWMSVTLHWLLFLLIAGMIAGGKYSDSLSENDKIIMLIYIHKQIGIAVLSLMAFRLLWRLINSRPDGLSDSSFIKLAAFIVHWTLYLAVMLQALSGIIMSQLSGRAVSFLNVIKVPSLAELTDPILQMMSFVPLWDSSLPEGAQMRALHDWNSNLIIVLVSAHVLGALMHHFILSDDTLRRMWFGYVPGYMKDSHRNF